MINEILLRRRSAIVVPLEENKAEDTETYLAAMLKNVEAYGYRASERLYERLKTCSQVNLLKMYQELIEAMQSLSGGSVIYEPMYPNFPREVMETDEAILYLNAYIHYITDGQVKPNIEKKPRCPLLNIEKVQTIDLIEDEEIRQMTSDLIKSKTSLSKQDKSDLVTLINYVKEKYLPSDIPHKENMAYVMSVIAESMRADGWEEENVLEVLKRYIFTAADVLRFVVALSDGDVSLAQPCEFITFPRARRRTILYLLDNASDLREEMQHRREQFIRLGEKLHPGEFPVYRNAFKAFSDLREDVKTRTFRGKFDKYIKEGNYDGLIRLLKTRPGELAARLDHLIRAAPDDLARWDAIQAFADVSDKVSTPLLLRVQTHFEHRAKPQKYRVFFPKGDIAKSKLVENNLSPMNRKFCSRISQICQAVLVYRFSKLEPIGSVYIDPVLCDYFIPSQQRSASEGKMILTRGSRLSIAEGAGIIRPFIHWKNIPKEGVPGGIRTDVDLSANVYDEDWNHLTHIAYTNLKDEKYGMCHSGDIIDAPKGACEFIDIDTKKARDEGARYVTISVFAYSVSKFGLIPECFVGWMERYDADSGEVFEPSAVKNKITLSAPSYIALPMIVDLKENKVIWADFTLKENETGWINVESNSKSIKAACIGVTQMHKTSVFDLAFMHVVGRGNLVANPKDADTVFASEKPENMKEGARFISPYMTDVIAGEFMQ